MSRTDEFERDLAAVVSAVEAGLDLPAVLEVACRAVERTLSATRVTAYTLSEDGASLIRAAGDGPARLEPPAGTDPVRRGDRVTLPLVSARRVLGALVADGAAEQDLARARLVAGMSAQAVEASRLWESAGIGAGTLDLLTRLPNHRGFQSVLGRELARAKRTGQSLAVAVVDLQGMGVREQRLGHGEGDRLLRSAAECFARGVRSYDCVCRIGGERFALVLPGIGAGPAATLVGRLASSLDASVSGGVASFPAHAATQAELVGLATAAQRSAREDGGHQVVAYDPQAVEAAAAESRAVYERTARSLEASRGHSATARAVSEYAGYLAGELGMTPDHVDRVRLAAFLYDTTTPAGDRAERARLAARVAANALDEEAAGWLLAPRSALPDAPLEARVIAVADAFVAAGGHASNAGAGRALAELWRRAGDEFDPGCVRALEGLLAAAGAAGDSERA
ncbi:MAG: diguanylate cyclase domain-containing protein [Gaiellales bacterium]